MNEEKKVNQYINLVKFFACILITNSHCVYHNPLLKIGGGWGNSIFFVVSGFLLGEITLDFGPWIRKRLIRVVPLTLIMTVFAIFIYGTSNASAFEHLTRFWFIIAIILYYFPFYVADKMKNGYWIFLVIYFLGYIVLYIAMDKSTFFVEKSGFAPFKVYFYFLLMLVGGIIKHIYLKFEIKKPGIFVLTGFGGLFIWFIEYYFVRIQNNMLEYQFIINLGITIFGTSVLLWTIAMNNQYSKWKMPLYVNLISESTLEIYLVQITFLPLISRILYPISIVCFWGIAICGGIILHIGQNRLYKICNY